MKIKYIDEGIGIECTILGDATLDKILKAAEEVYSEEYITKQKYQIIDFTECTSFQLSSDDMRAIVEVDLKVSKSNPGLIIAIIAPKDIAFGMSRVYEAYADETGFRIKVFRDKKESQLWIQKQLNNNA